MTAILIQKVEASSRPIQLLQPIKDSAINVYNILLYGIKQFFFELHELEQLFINVNFIFTLLCQIIFFTMLDVVSLDKPCLKSGKHVVTGTSALLLYTILAYFVKKIKDVIDNYWNYSYGAVNSIRTFLYCLWKIVLEISRASSMVFCLRDCSTSYHFNFLHTLMSFTYYGSTEKIFTDVLISITSYFKYSQLDSMEHLYIPIILKSYSILSAVVISAILFFGKHSRFVMFASYFTIYLRLKDLYFNYIKTLILERKIYESFKEATCKEIKEWDDVCAICINHMDVAKVTSCKHLFHPLCLKECLKSSLYCPLCKQMFVC